MLADNWTLRQDPDSCVDLTVLEIKFSPRGICRNTNATWENKLAYTVWCDVRNAVVTICEYQVIS